MDNAWKSSNSYDGNCLEFKRKTSQRASVGYLWALLGSRDLRARTRMSDRAPSFHDIVKGIINVLAICLKALGAQKRSTMFHPATQRELPEDNSWGRLRM